MINLSYEKQINMLVKDVVKWMRLTFVMFVVGLFLGVILF